MSSDSGGRRRSFPLSLSGVPVALHGAFRGSPILWPVRVSCRLAPGWAPAISGLAVSHSGLASREQLISMYSRVALVLVLHDEDRIRHEPQVSILRSLRCSLVFSWRVPSVPSMIGRVLPVCLYLRVVVRAHGCRLDHSYIDGLAGVWKEEARLWFALSCSTHPSAHGPQCTSFSTLCGHPT